MKGVIALGKRKKKLKPSIGLCIDDMDKSD